MSPVGWYVFFISLLLSLTWFLTYFFICFFHLFLLLIIAGVTHWLSENILGIKPNYGILSPLPSFLFSSRIYFELLFTNFCSEPLSYTILPQVSLQHDVTQVSGSLQTPIGKITVTWDAVKGSYVITTPDLVTIKVGVPLEDPLNGGCTLEVIKKEDGGVVWAGGKVADQTMSFIEVYSFLCYMCFFRLLTLSISSSFLFSLSYFRMKLASICI